VGDGAVGHGQVAALVENAGALAKAHVGIRVAIDDAIINREVADGGVRGSAYAGDDPGEATAADGDVLNRQRVDLADRSGIDDFEPGLRLVNNHGRGGAV